MLNAFSTKNFQHSPNHKLATLVEYANIPTDGSFHRALYDSEMTAKVWLAMLDQIQENYNIQTIPFKLVQKLTKTPAKSVQRLLSSWK